MNRREKNCPLFIAAAKDVLHFLEDHQRQPKLWRMTSEHWRQVLAERDVNGKPSTVAAPGAYRPDSVGSLWGCAVLIDESVIGWSLS